MHELSDCDISWHFIGSIQSNKLKLIAEHFQWVHTLDNIKHAQRLNHFCESFNNVMNVCIEVNIDDEPSKAGVKPSDVLALAEQIKPLSHLSLRGLMCIPRATDDVRQQHASFASMAALQEQLGLHGFQVDSLSMGMSADYVAAISEGATMVRIGTAIFAA